MALSNDQLLASATDAITAAPVQPSARGLFSLQGRLIDWVQSLGPNALKLIPLDTLISVAEQAYDITIGNYNFPALPDIFEVPLKAYIRQQIRPLVSQVYASIVGS